MRLLVAAALRTREESLSATRIYAYMRDAYVIHICVYVCLCVHGHSAALCLYVGASVRFFALIKGNLSGTRLAIIISARSLLPLRILPSRVVLGCFSWSIIKTENQGESCNYIKSTNPNNQVIQVLSYKTMLKERCRFSYFLLAKLFFFI